MADRTTERPARFLLGYFRKERRALALLGGVTLGASALAALQPLPLKVLIDQGLKGEPLPDSLVSFFAASGPETIPFVIIAGAALASLLLQLIGGLLDALLNWQWALVGRRLVNRVNDDLYAALLRRSIVLHHREGVGDQLSRLTGDTWSVYTAAEGLLVAPPQQVIKLLLVVAVAWQLDPELTVVMAVMAPLLALSATLFGGPLKRRVRQVRQEESKLLSFVHQTLGVLPMIQAFGAEARQSGQFRDLARGAVAASQRRVLQKHLFLLVNGLTLAIGTSVVLYLGGRRVLEGSMTLGVLIVFLPYMRMMESSFRALLESWTKLKGVGVSVERILERMRSTDMVPERPLARALAPVRHGRQVRLERVTFGYVPGQPVLRECDLEADAGDTLAIVGPTGSGKSTLAGLILRFFDPWSGHVLIDGVEVRDLTLSSLRSNIAFVPQEAYLLPGTVADNIAYGKPGASRAAILAAAEAARAHGFIEALPNGYETQLGERGVSLSGGQRQRLALARALLKDAPILILDEPTSALDESTESEFVETLRRMKGRSTNLVITHRPAILAIADRITSLCSVAEVRT